MQRIERTVLLALLLAAPLLLTACDQLPIIKGDKGDKGEQGPPGQRGPAGPPGLAGSGIRFEERTCEHACTIECSPEERVVNAYALGPNSTFVHESDRRVTYRAPSQRTSSTVVVICALRGS